MKTYRKTAHPTHKGGAQGWTETETSDTLNAFDITELRMPILVLNKVDMQQTTGTLNPGAHPGSYNGQDAYNDMFVVDNGSGSNRERTSTEHEDKREGRCAELYARSASDYEGGRSVETIVRRLTPMECERLQGMPDDWSRWGLDENGKVYELSDSARYKIQGNGIATPFWRWLLLRISAQYERPATLGSLFSGQGSFEMLWENINGKGSAVWSSEIDKNAAAVARYHFPETERQEKCD